MCEITWGFMGFVHCSHLCYWNKWHVLSCLGLAPYEQTPCVHACVWVVIMIMEHFSVGPDWISLGPEATRHRGKYNKWNNAPLQLGAQLQIFIISAYTHANYSHVMWFYYNIVVWGVMHFMSHMHQINRFKEMHLRSGSSQDAERTRCTHGAVDLLDG